MTKNTKNNNDKPITETTIRQGTSLLKLLGVIGSGLVFIVGTAFAASEYLDKRYSARFVDQSQYRMFAFNVNQAFMDTHRMIIYRELRWMDQMDPSKMTPSDRRHYERLQQSQRDLDRRAQELRRIENGGVPLPASPPPAPPTGQ